MNSRLGICVIFGLSVVLLFGLRLNGTSFPSCKSPVADRVVKSTFNRHILSQLLKLEMTGLQKQRTVFSGAREQVCMAVATVNQEHREISYTFYWADPDRTQYAVRLEEAVRPLNYADFTNSLRRQFGGE